MPAVCLLMGGGPASVYAPRAWEAFLEFANPTDDPVGQEDRSEPDPVFGESALLRAPEH